MNIILLIIIYIIIKKKEEIDIESIVKQLKPCKKLNKENISDEETNLKESGKNFHKIPYSSKNNSFAHKSC